MKSKVSAPRTFRVPITVPLEGKVKAVAEYKRRKRAKELESSTPPAGESNKPLMTLMEGTPEYEDGQAKLEQLYLKGQELRAELHSLNSVRSSLLWLLKKANTLDIQRNHLTRTIPS